MEVPLYNIRISDTFQGKLFVSPRLPPWGGFHLKKRWEDLVTFLIENSCLLGTRTSLSGTRGFSARKIMCCVWYFFLPFCFFVCCDLSVRCCCCFICPKSALRCKQLKNVVLCLISFFVFVFCLVWFVCYCSLICLKSALRYKQLITASTSHSLKEFVRPWLI